LLSSSFDRDARCAPRRTNAVATDESGAFGETKRSFQTLMCLAVPARIRKRDGEYALVELGGVVRGASLALVPAAAEGDWILLHAGYAIQTLDEAAARETLDLITEAWGLRDEGAEPESVPVALEPGFAS
jgi:hydrogenase expression/formation protein HypC